MRMLLICVTVFSLLPAQTTRADEFSYALKLYQDKFYDLAIKEFDQFIRKYPNATQTPDAKYYLALSHRDYKQPEKALELFRRVAIDYPKYSRAPEAWFEAAEILKTNKEYADAASAYETIKLLYSNSSITPNALLEASFMYQAADNLPKAMFVCRVIIDEYGDSDVYQDARLQLIRLLRQDGKLAEAKLELSRIAVAPKLWNDIVFEHAQIKLAENDFDAALDSLKLIIKTAPTYKRIPDVYAQTGEIYFRINNLSKSVEMLQKSLAIRSSPRIHERLGDAFYLQKKFSDAVRSYTKSDRIHGRIKKALANQFAANDAGAEQDFKVIFDQFNKVPADLADHLILRRAQGLKRLGDRLTIVGFLDEYLPKMKSTRLEMDATLLLGSIYESRLEFDPALSVYNRFLLANPTFPGNDEMLWRKANLLEKTNQTNEAVKIYKQIAQAYPNSRLRNDIRSKLSRGSVGQTRTNASVMNRMAEILADVVGGGDKGQQHIALGLLYFQDLNQYDKAVAQFDKAATVATSKNIQLEALLHKADVLYTKARLSNIDSLYTASFSAYGDVLKRQPDTEIHFNASTGIIRSQLAMIRTEPDYHQRAIAYYQKLLSEHRHRTDLDPIRMDLSGHFEAIAAYDSAKAVYSRVKSDAYKENALLKLGMIYQKQDSLTQAADQYRTILANLPNSRSRYLVIRQLAELEHKLNRIENSVAFRKMIVNEFPYMVTPADRTEIVNFHLARQEVEEAQKYIDQNSQRITLDDFVLIREFNLISYENILQLARLFDVQGKNQLAIQYYQDYLRAAKAGDDVNDIQRAIAEIYIEENRPDQAVKYYERIAKSYRDYDKIQISLALLYFNTEDFAKCAKMTTDVLKSMDLDNRLYSTMRRNQLISQIKSAGLKNFKAQLAAYTKQFPADEEGQALLMFEYAKRERELKNFTRSNNILEDLIDDYDETSFVDDATYLRGLNYITVNNFKKALEIFAEFPKDFPTSPLLGEFYNSLGTLLEQFQKNDDAIDAYKRALVSSKDPDIKRISYAKLISLYNKLGLYESVISTATTFVQLYPADPRLIDIKILIGQSLSALKRGAESVRYLKRLKLEADSEREPEIQYWIAFSYYQQGDFETAISEFIKIPLLSKKTRLQWVPSAYYYAGRSYEKLGKQHDAVRMYQKIVDTPGIDAVFKRDAQKRIDQLRKG